jgi:hypothetical protein
VVREGQQVIEESAADGLVDGVMAAHILADPQEIT